MLKNNKALKGCDSLFQSNSWHNLSELRFQGFKPGDNVLQIELSLNFYVTSNSYAKDQSNSESFQGLLVITLEKSFSSSHLRPLKRKIMVNL